MHGLVVDGGARSREVVAQPDRGARRTIARGVGKRSGGPAVEVPEAPGSATPVIRGFLFKRVLKNAGFPKGKTN